MEVTNCPLTGLPISDFGNLTYTDNKLVYWYRLKVNKELIPIALCEVLVSGIGWDSELTEAVKRDRILIIAELSKNNFKLYQRKVFHWNCQIDDLQNHINLKQLLNDIKTKGEYPRSRKEKSDNLLRHLYNSQSFEGAELVVKADLEYYGSLYFISFEEMKFYLRDLQRKEILDYKEDSQIVQFTFYGLEYFDTLKKSRDFSPDLFSKRKFQIGLSFAGEDRVYVEDVAKELKRLGISFFYDSYEQTDLWGKDLYQHLNNIYKNECEYCIIFISAHYAIKLWAMHELKSVQARAFNENREYILPVRFDDTELPGVNSTVAYLDGNKITASDLAKLAAQKVLNQQG